MTDKQVDASPFLSQIETFEISDKKNENKKKKNQDIHDEYKDLEDFHVIDEIDEEKKNDSSVEEKKVTTRTVNITVDRKKLRKIFSSQFYTHTATDDSSSTTHVSKKYSRTYLLFEFFKRFFIIILFFITSIYVSYFLLNKYLETKHICRGVDLYNYAYEETIYFHSNISNDQYYIFSGKFPFDVMTYQLRKDTLRNSMNTEIERYMKENKQSIFNKINNLDDHEIQILSFIDISNKKKCEYKIFNLYKPVLLKSVNTTINKIPYLISEINYNFITNPYNYSEKRLYAELIRFIKKNEEVNKFCFFTSYLKSLKEDFHVDPYQIIPLKPIHEDESSSENSTNEPKEETEEQNNNNNNNSTLLKGASNLLNNETFNKVNFEKKGNVKHSSKQKIIYLYDSYDTNGVFLLLAIYHLQYENTHHDLKKYWNDIKKKFKTIRPEEIYLLEWYCLAINYNIIQNNNQYKLNCVDLLK